MKDPPATVSQMTLAQKASLCSGLNMWELQGIERLGIPSIIRAIGPHGLQKQTVEKSALPVHMPKLKEV